MARAVSEAWSRPCRRSGRAPPRPPRRSRPVAARPRPSPRPGPRAPRRRSVGTRRAPSRSPTVRVKSTQYPPCTPPKSSTTRSPSASTVRVGRACGSALFGPDATIVSKAGFSNPARFSRQSISAADLELGAAAPHDLVEHLPRDPRQSPRTLAKRSDSRSRPCARGASTIRSVSTSSMPLLRPPRGALCQPRHRATGTWPPRSRGRSNRRPMPPYHPSSPHRPRRRAWQTGDRSPCSLRAARERARAAQHPRG